MILVDLELNTKYSVYKYRPVHLLKKLEQADILFSKQKSNNEYQLLFEVVF